MGGSADLTGSNNTKGKGMDVLNQNNFLGQYIHYGVREHGMAAIMNGIAATKLFKTYSGTFLSFADYMKPSLRLAALMQIDPIQVFTHDSIGLGEDGPTHQPVEHLSALRAIPNLEVWRPADSVETLEVWQASLQSLNTPSVIALSRQNLKPVRKKFIKNNLSAFGAYILVDNDDADICLYSSFSEI